MTETTNHYGLLTSSEVKLFEGIEDSGEVQGLALLVDQALQRHIDRERVWMSASLSTATVPLRKLAQEVADR